MTTFRFLTIFLAGSVFAGVLYAQEAQVEEIPQGSINQDVRVVREYNPTVSDAFKINEMPEQDDAGVPVPEFSYQLSGRALVGAPEVVPLIPAKMAREPRAELMNSFAEGWLGNYNLVGGRLLYNIVQNESYALALRAGHESSLGDIEVDDSDEDADYHHTTAGLYMRHFFKRNKTLRLDMDFSNFATVITGLRSWMPQRRMCRLIRVRYFPRPGRFMVRSCCPTRSSTRRLLICRWALAIRYWTARVRATI